MYLTTAHYTVDGADCRLIWSSTWTPREHEPLNTHRGAALADGKIIRGTNDGLLLALDTKDGHTLWARQIADPKEGYFISMPPVVHGDLIYIGPAGAETAARVGWLRFESGTASKWNESSLAVAEPSLTYSQYEAGISALKAAA
jgi:alcohol dehydrogenase (cytochrome c)